MWAVQQRLISWFPEIKKIWQIVPFFKYTCTFMGLTAFISVTNQEIQLFYCT